MNFNITECGLYLIERSDSPLEVIPVIDDTIQLFCGMEHSAVVDGSGKVYTFGYNDSGQLGLGHKSNFIREATQVTALSGTPISQVAFGDASTLFLSAEGEVFGCGCNENGQLGLANTVKTLIPTKLIGIPPIKKIASGCIHSVLLAVNGDVFVAGYNGYGQLGLGNKESRAAFTILPSRHADISSVSCGPWYTALFTSSGILSMAGRNENGELGLGNTTDSCSFQQVSLPSAVTAVACGYFFAVALTSDGTVWSWGLNEDGYLGIGTVGSCLTPQKIVGLDNHVITKVIAGCDVTAVITKMGEVLMCGNVHARLRDGAKAPKVMTLVPKATQLVVDQVGLNNEYTMMVVVPKPESLPPQKQESDVSLCENSIMKAL